ncbi:MAG: S8 family serine peptidase [Nonomuraea sp.]|nr:S8 family serine peptidase [Nonomuraea sp.]
MTAVLAGAVLAMTALAAPGAATPSPEADAKNTAGTTVTLITGDVVTYTPSQRGTPQVGIRPAERSDGSAITFATFPDDDGGYLVLPSDAAALVSSGALDEELFDVDTLVRERRLDEIPLLTTYTGDRSAASLARTADALPGSEHVKALDSINGAAMRVKAGQAKKFWAGVRADRRSSSAKSASGLSKIWLDRRIKPALDQSVPLIGAPTAWQQGFDGQGVKLAVLDTGIDATHPDFSGRITATHNFSDSPDMTDKIGHGTHVASIAAGSGSASNGRYKGVAPGASLLVGKVFADDGYGDTSWAIQAMAWAAEQGADVVNMSFGVCCTGGDDPMSQAVDELTEQYGTLYVAAAGNDGDNLTVGSPGAADQALTVGAVDKTTGTTLAGFSSRGPRLDDAAVKPNIVAPGVNIEAARSSASTRQPASDNPSYTIDSGTSMASPHVAGAAALLAQRHPDWHAAELRDALTSTAERNSGLSWFEQGSGRVNVTRAVTQTVFASSVVDFHLVGATPATKQITYRNTGSQPVTLSLAPVTRGWSGNPAPAGAVSLAAQSVTVPADGTATVALTVDPAAGPIGAYGGWITATATGVNLVTPFSYYSGPATHTLGISLLNSYGTKEFFPGYQAEPLVYVVPLKRANSPEDPFNPYAYYYGKLDYSGNAEVRLPAGDYEVIGVAGESRVSNRTSWVIKTISLTADQTVTLDSRQTVRVRPNLDVPADGEGWIRYVRTFTDRSAPFSLSGGASGGGNDLYVTPVSSVTAGTLRLSHQWDLQPPVLTSVTAGQLALHPAYDLASVRNVVTSTTTYPVVWVGQGRAEDFDGVDVSGKLVLAGIPLGTGATPYVAAGGAMDDASRLAYEHGAKGILSYLDVTGGKARVPANGSSSYLTFGLGVDEGRALRAALDGGPVSLRLERYEGAPVSYRLRLDKQGQVPAQADNVGVAQLAKVEVNYHADQADTSGWSYGESSTGDAVSTLTYGGPLTLPQTRTEYFGPVRDDVVWKRTITSQGLEMNTADVFTQAGTRTERWFKAPLAPGAADVPQGYPASVPCVMCRGGDRFVPAEQWLDSDPRHFSGLSQITSAPQLTVNGQQLAAQSRYPRYFTVPAGSAWYALTATDTSGRTLSSKVASEWRFTSPAPSGAPSGYTCPSGTSCAFQPAVLLRYDVPLDTLNRAPAGQAFAFDLRAGVHARVPQPSPVTSVQVQYSVNDGSSWQAVQQVSDKGGGLFQVQLTHPALAATNGFVSLRVTAYDSGGGSVTQTITRAYALR